jgi:hypothetical protein
VNSDTSPHALPQLVDAAERLVADYADLPSGEIAATLTVVHTELGPEASTDDIEQAARARLDAQPA